MKQVLFFVCALALLCTAFGSMFVKEEASIEPEVGKNGKYNATLAMTLLNAAGLAYCKPATIKSWSCGLACTNLVGFTNYYTYQAAIDPFLAFSILINDNAKQVVYTFRGTDSIVQLVQEILKGKGAPYSTDKFNVANAEVLAYFQNVYKKNFQSLVLSKLKTLGASNRSSYEFIFTGHSLGGALATLAALDASTWGYVKVTATSPFLMTFGSPRVGNYVFAGNVSEIIPESYRVVHNNDIVPHVPPCPGELPTEECKQPKGYSELTAGVSEGYWYGWHITEEIFYNEASTSWRACSQNNGEDPTCSDHEVILSFSAHDVYLGVHIDTLCTN